MLIALEGHALETAVHETLVCLLPEERHGTDPACEAGSGRLVSGLEEQAGGFTAWAEAVRGGRTRRDTCTLPKNGDGALERKRVATRAVKTAVYRAVVGFLPEPPVWGAMSGVKPAKPVRQAFPQGIDPAEADKMLAEQYYIAPSRRRLAIRCAPAAQD